MRTISAFRLAALGLVLGMTMCGRESESPSKEPAHSPAPIPPPAQPPPPDPEPPPEPEPPPPEPEPPPPEPDPPPPEPPPPLPEIVADGGAGTASGGPGGTIRIRSLDGLVLGSTNPPPQPPEVPAPPTEGSRVTSQDLASDLARIETLIIDGLVTSSGDSEVRTITSTNGDIVVRGTLRGGDRGASTQGFHLSAPVGTIWVTGKIATSGGDGTADGDAGGPITLAARRIVVTGTLDAGGESNGAGLGGAAGDLSLTAKDEEMLLRDAHLLAVGGSGTAEGGAGGDATLWARLALRSFGEIRTGGGEGGSTGGGGGRIDIFADGPIDLVSTLESRGAASVSGKGGGAGTIRIDGGGALRYFGKIDLRGGAGADGGAGGSVTLGEDTWPATIETGPGLYTAGGGPGGTLGGEGGEIEIETTSDTLDTRLSLEARGGPGGGKGGYAAVQNFSSRGRIVSTSSIDVSGGAPGGKGGTIEFLLYKGSLEPGGTLAARGADSDAAAGRGGTLRVKNFSSGGVVGSFRFDGTGGNGATGGKGGRLEIAAYGWDGTVTFASPTYVDLTGGAGSGQAGAGGEIDIDTPDGDVSISGTYLARGGTGGTGGLGGLFSVSSDNDADATGGNITIETDGFIDVSGGDGEIGGSARNDGTSGVTNVDPYCAVKLDADSGNPAPNINAEIVNRGKIVARGGAKNGNGGDVWFHGHAEGYPEGPYDPVSGEVDVSGDGTGKDGQFLGD